MSTEEFRWRAFRGLAHFVPQGDGRVRVVAGAGRQFQADQVGFVFIAAAVGQSHQQVDPVVAHGDCFLRCAGDQGDLLQRADTVGLGHRFTAMLAQGVGDFMTHDRGDFVIGQLQLLDQAAVENDLAARTAVGVELIALDQVDFPVPLRGIRAEDRGLGNQPIGDRLDAPGIGTGLVQHVLAVRFADLLLIGLRVGLVDLIARQHAEHVLLAIDPDSTAAGGVDRLATRQQQRGGECTQNLLLTHENAP